MIYNGVLDLIGKTPIVKVNNSNIKSKELDGLPLGRYYWKELKPSPGFNINNQIVEFEIVKDPVSGHAMEVFTNMEGCQLYTGNYIKDIVGKNGRVYENHEAYCLETQCFPDSPNKKEFPTCILEPGQKMKAKTIYSFTI